jgi:hypothetical protein
VLSPLSFESDIIADVSLPPVYTVNVWVIEPFAHIQVKKVSTTIAALLSIRYALGDGNG